LGVNILLHASDTKAKRPESFRVPAPLLPYLRRYLEEIRPRLIGRSSHDGLWASYRGQPLSDGQIYQIARARILKEFGKAMGLHDFRRAASTFLAMDAPEKIGLIPGVLPRQMLATSTTIWRVRCRQDTAFRHTCQKLGLGCDRFRQRMRADHACCYLRPVQYRLAKRVKHRRSGPSLPRAHRA
jgi:hypothetical protein